MPGRTNYFEADGVKCLIDYGHNVPALQALEPLVNGLATQRKIGVATAPGNRRDEDLAALGAQLATMCDTLFVYETDARGREAGETAKLIHDGAAESGRICCRVETIMDERRGRRPGHRRGGGGRLPAAAGRRHRGHDRAAQGPELSDAGRARAGTEATQGTRHKSGARRPRARSMTRGWKDDARTSSSSD